MKECSKEMKHKVVQELKIVDFQSQLEVRRNSEQESSDGRIC